MTRIGDDCAPDCCPSKPLLAERKQLTHHQAKALGELFGVLAGATRLRLLHALVRSGELCMTDLADLVGMKAQAVSNQLRSLVHQGILGDRRDGAHVYYRIVDPCVPGLLDLGLCLLEDARPRATKR